MKHSNIDFSVSGDPFEQTDPRSRKNQPIGLFDSGVGGLSVWRHVRQVLPGVPLLYIADQAHLPYGRRSPEQIRSYATTITHHFVECGAATVVVACNTATAAAVDHLRQTFPALSIVGMEPAIKPAVATTRSGRIGVLATATTFQSQRYHALIERFAPHCLVVQDPCRGLVEAIEAGRLAGAEMRQMIASFVEPMLAVGVDTLILGCTHYPFVQPLIEEICGPTVAIIDPAPAVARQTARVYAGLKGNEGSAAPTTFFTTASDPAVRATFAAFLQRLDPAADPQVLPLFTDR